MIQHPLTLDPSQTYKEYYHRNAAIENPDVDDDDDDDVVNVDDDDNDRKMPAPASNADINDWCDIMKTSSGELPDSSLSEKIRRQTNLTDDQFDKIKEATCQAIELTINSINTTLDEEKKIPQEGILELQCYIRNATREQVLILLHLLCPVKRQCPIQRIKRLLSYCIGHDRPPKDMLPTCPTARFVERLLSALNDPWGVITSECRWWPDPYDRICSSKEGRDAVKLWNLVGTFYFVIGGKLSFVNIGGTSTRIKEEIADHLIPIIDICIASGPHCSLFSYFNRCYRTVENAQSRLTRHFWKLCVGLNIEWFFDEMVKDPMFPMITDLNNPEQGVRDWLSARRRIKAMVDAEKWNERIALLQQYKSENGNCEVPRSDEKLGAWVAKQRHHYKLFQKGQHSQLTEERIQELNDLGFIWEVGAGRGEAKAKTDASKWDNQFRLLQQYKSVKGDCEVPRSHKVGDVNLGTWVSNQRQQYKLFQKGQPSQMTDKRIQRLNSLDFAWVLGKGGKRK